jgi:hypothetical protein
MLRTDFSNIDFLTCGHLVRMCNVAAQCLISYLEGPKFNFLLKTASQIIRQSLTLMPSYALKHFLLSILKLILFVVMLIAFPCRF